MRAKQSQTFQIDSSMLQYAIIPWDSEYLHNTTVEIENFSVKSFTALKKIIAQFQHALHLIKGDLMFSKIPLEDYPRIQMLDQAGFYYIEQSITLDVDLSVWKPNEFIFQRSGTYQLIPASLQDKQSIRQIAQSTFTADRFHLDPNIAKAKADYRFEMWIENSFHSSDTIYKFVDKENTIIGFFIVHERPEYAEFRLAGLDPQYVGRGLGKMLYHHMYRLLKEKKYKTIKSVISLNNIQVLNVYMYLTHAKFNNPLIVLHKVL